MKQEIIRHLEHPKQLESLYRKNKSAFRKAFNDLYNEIDENPVAQAWHARLNFEGEEISWGTKAEWLFVIVVSFISGLIAKIPDLTFIKSDDFYPRNIAFIVFPMLMVYFIRRQKLPMKNVLGMVVCVLISAVYINILPGNNNNDTFVLACIHLVLFQWSLLGYAFTRDQPNENRTRPDFLRYNGDLIVMSALLLLAFGILSAITIGLFELIDIKIEEYYFRYVAIWGIASIPVIGTQLIQVNPQMVNKISPVIARIFTPLVIITLVVYLGAVLFTGKDPYNDREFLMIFNILLLGVMALIFFSIADIAGRPYRPWMAGVLLVLTGLTLAINSIATSAVMFRIFEWGITPNRMAVMGGNLLILTNLLLIFYRLLKTLQRHGEIQQAENSISVFLPVYAAWAAIVTFFFPFLFGFR